MDKELRTEFRIDDKLSMRAWNEADIDAAFEIVIRNLEHLQTFMIWATPDYSMESARKFITEGIANMRDRKNAGWGIFRGEEVIGSIGFVKLDCGARSCEIGYWIDKNEEGKGVITRACKILIDYAFEELDMNRVEIRCSTENARSAAVPERLGFTREGHLRQTEMIHGRLHDFYIYGLLAHDPRLW